MSDVHCELASQWDSHITGHQMKCSCGVGITAAVLLYVLCFCVFSVGSRLTRGGVWWAKLQRVAQHMIVVPDIKLVVSRVVVHRGDVLIGVGERDVDGLLAGSVGIVGVHHQVAACFAVIVLVDGPHGVEHTTRHEGIGRHPLVKAGLPGAFKTQGVRVHLQAKEKGQGLLYIGS